MPYKYLNSKLCEVDSSQCCVWASQEEIYAHILRENTASLFFSFFFISQILETHLSTKLTKSR